VVAQDDDKNQVKSFCDSSQSCSRFGGRFSVKQTNYNVESVENGEKGSF
jgi:hypothetical protein